MSFRKRREIIDLAIGGWMETAVLCASRINRILIIHITDFYTAGHLVIVTGRRRLNTSWYPLETFLRVKIESSNYLLVMINFEDFL